MKVAELIEALEDADPGDEVFIASYGHRTRLQLRVSRMAMISGGRPGVYLLEGDTVGYLSGEACDEFGL